MAGTRTLVQLDDKLLEIKENTEGKLTAKALSTDDLVEVSLLDEGVQKMLENDVHKIANEAYNELKKDFKATLKQNVLKVVGFSNSWHSSGWEVDHCNGRNSELTTYLSDKVKEMFRTEFDALIQTEVAELVKPLKKELNSEFKEYFLREVQRQSREQATLAAKEFLANLMTREVAKYQKKAIEQAGTAFLGKQKSASKEEEEDDF
jgi:hypothetical protein